MYSLRTIPVSIILLFLSLPAKGGNPYRFSAGAGESGQGSVSIMQTGFWPCFTNQALLAHNNSFSAGINYDNKFNISELGTRTAAIIIPAGKTSIGIIYSDFGYPAFHRGTGGLACGMALSENISAGLQIDYISERSSGEDLKNRAVTFEAGLLLSPGDNISIGIQLFNPLPNSLRKSYIPSTIKAGAGIRLNNLLFAGAEAELSSGDKLLIRTGFNYEAAKNFWLRCGFSSENTSFSFGTGILIKAAALDLSFVSHEKLDVTSSLSIVYKIK